MKILRNVLIKLKYLPLDIKKLEIKNNGGNT